MIIRSLLKRINKDEQEIQRLTELLEDNRSKGKKNMSLVLLIWSHGTSNITSIASFAFYGILAKSPLYLCGCSFSSAKRVMPLPSIKFEIKASISNSANISFVISSSIPAGCASLGLE
nr:hypothetical protein Iba_chr06fCG8890 [Ipomoea batatas]